MTKPSKLQLGQKKTKNFEGKEIRKEEKEEKRYGRGGKSYLPRFLQALDRRHVKASNDLHHGVKVIEGQTFLKKDK
jgi:hypothetical protein